LQEQRKQVWIRCLNFAAILSELREQGEAVLSRVAGHVQLLDARQVPENAVQDGSSLGGNDSAGAGAENTGTVDEVGRMMTQAHEAALSYRLSANEQRYRLARATDDAAQAAGLMQEVMYVEFIFEIVSAMR
jgi:hypothetical protein